MQFIKTFFIFYSADLQQFTTTWKNKVCNSFLFCHSFSTSLAIQLSIKPIKPMYIAVDDPYYESAVGEMITKQRAFLELEKHGIEDYEEFLSDVGDKLEYLATDVLDWLGY